MASSRPPVGFPADRRKVPPGFWRAFEHLGVKPAALLRQARLPATLHLDPKALVTTAQDYAIWSALETLTGDPAIGIRFVQALESTGHQPLFLAACYASDYRDGIARIARFKRLCTPERVRLEEGDGQLAISRDSPYAMGPEPAVLADVSFCFMLELGRKGTGHAIKPKRVEFTRPGPASDLQQRFFDCPIHFGAERNRLVLRASDLDRPFPGHNPELLDILTPALSAALGESQVQGSVGEQVKVAVKRRLASGRPEVVDVAHDLGMSERTLQRRITQEGTTFRDLLTEARQELGRQFLSDPTIEVNEVACLLGYQDTTSFYRAFRDWEGVTPGRWRALDEGEPPSGSGPMAH
jgi:AraC-like DNA-binding protein